jgi:hypothetical protein
MSKVPPLKCVCGMRLSYHGSQMSCATVLPRGYRATRRISKVICRRNGTVSISLQSPHMSFPYLTFDLQRCWHDAEDYLPPPGPHVDPLLRPMQQGEVGVSFLRSGIRDIVPESSFTLVDRSFQLGDLCKRSIDDVRSGVVTSVDVKARLAHAISDAPIEGWKSVDQFEKSTTAEIGDYVLNNDWVGQVGTYCLYLTTQYLTFTQVIEVGDNLLATQAKSLIPCMG